MSIHIVISEDAFAFLCVAGVTLYLSLLAWLSWDVSADTTKKACEDSGISFDPLLTPKPLSLSHPPTVRMRMPFPCLQEGIKEG